tara:strand:- start:88 stop:612 length:525 start_codon:yes stop_codon:yes gene_type:complete
MSRLGRKIVLKAAKDQVNQNIEDKLAVLLEKLDDLRAEEGFDKEAERVLLEEHHRLLHKQSDLRSSNRAKKKRSIQWSVEKSDFISDQYQNRRRGRKIISSEALTSVKDAAKNASKPRASASWLQEGGLVTDRKGSEVMVVLKVDSTGIVQVLKDGLVRDMRDLSLRPAFDDED